MDFGVALFITDETLTPPELGRLVEERGFESLWIPEHTHIPAQRVTPHPAGVPLPAKYSQTYDPFVVLGAVAAVTERLVLGTGICLVAQRDPIITAKETATLDQLSGGRFAFGIGAGWNREEMMNHGTDPKTRFAVMRERMEAIRVLWTEDEGSYAGDHVRFDRVWSWPKPVQEGGPPVLVGGNGPTVHDRVLEFGDGWMPNVLPDTDTILRRVDELRRRADRHVPVTLNVAKPDPARLARYEEAGIDRCLFALPSGDRAAIEQRVDVIERAISVLR